MADPFLHITSFLWNNFAWGELRIIKLKWLVQMYNILGSFHSIMHISWLALFSPPLPLVISKDACSVDSLIRKGEGKGRERKEEGKGVGRRSILGKGNRHYLSNFKCLWGTIGGYIFLCIVGKGKIKCTPLQFMGIKYILKEALSIYNNFMIPLFRSFYFQSAYLFIRVHS